MKSRTTYLLASLIILTGAHPRGFGQALELHGVFPGGSNCSQRVAKQVHIPVGTVILKLHIKNYSTTNQAGVPLWWSFNLWQPQSKNWAGWAVPIGAAGGSSIKLIRAKMTPTSPKHGDDLVSGRALCLQAVRPSSVDRTGVLV
jgi:hypothetical protein